MSFGRQYKGLWSVRLPEIKWVGWAVMKRILGAGLLSLFASTFAMAADLGVPPVAPTPAAPYVAPVYYRWGGIYIGINGGYAFGNSDWSTPAGSTSNFNLSGGLVGGTIGGNMQMGQFVYGLEGDLDWSDIRGSLTTPPFCTVACTLQTSNDWLGTARGRVGWAFDRVLFYGTAGAAFGDVKATFNPGAISNDSIEFGWTAGAGLEFLVTENLTAKAEYLFVDLAHGSCGIATTSCSVLFDGSLVRAGLNFKFNSYY